jgi:ABC-type lipoprotein export system ATPase subunit
MLRAFGGPPSRVKSKRCSGSASRAIDVDQHAQQINLLPYLSVAENMNFQQMLRSVIGRRPSRADRMA